MQFAPWHHSLLGYWQKKHKKHAMLLTGCNAGEKFF
jgi:hypothetical protein